MVLCSLCDEQTVVVSRISYSGAATTQPLLVCIKKAFHFSKTSGIPTSYTKRRSPFKMRHRVQQGYSTTVRKPCPATMSRHHRTWCVIQALVVHLSCEADSRRQTCVVTHLPPLQKKMPRYTGQIVIKRLFQFSWNWYPAK